jgi:hypothetical protein
MFPNAGPGVGDAVGETDGAGDGDGSAARALDAPQKIKPAESDISSNARCNNDGNLL